MKYKATDSIIDYFRKFTNNKYFRATEDILIFVIITLAIHYAWRFWAMQLAYSPFGQEMEALYQFMMHQLNIQTCWVLDHILSIPYTFHDNVIWFANTWGLSINESCSGLKQITQFALLMVLFPGPWKHKWWFIPSGMVVIYFVNLLRLVLLALTLNFIPDQNYFIHRYLLRALFYVVIFALWLAWIKYFYKGRLKPEPDTGDH